MGVARFAKLLGMAGFTSVCGLEHENLREMDLWYALVFHMWKNLPRNIGWDAGKVGGFSARVKRALCRLGRVIESPC